MINAGLGAVGAALERAVDAGDFVAVQFVGVLAEVPDVAVLVLREPVERVLRSARRLRTRHRGLRRT